MDALENDYKITEQLYIPIHSLYFRRGIWNKHWYF